MISSTQSHLLTLSQANPSVWVVELHNGADSRLTRSLILDAFLPALDRVEKEWRDKRKTLKNGNGALVITGNMSQDKFFSNGVDLPAALDEPGFWKNVFNPLMARILTFPIPTVASINGHAFAGGWLIAAACDYRVMSSGKCWGSMPEIFLGSDFPFGLIVLLRMKLSDSVLLRKQVLEGHRWTPQELLTSGMVEEIVDGGSKRTLQHALSRAETMSCNANSGVWGLNKRVVYREVLDAFDLDRRLVTPEEDAETAQRRLSPAARL